jgi:hypothetical protein
MLYDMVGEHYPELDEEELWNKQSDLLRNEIKT